jgi:hypothetical protein
LSSPSITRSSPAIGATPDAVEQDWKRRRERASALIKNFPRKYPMDQTPSVVSNYAHVIANRLATPHACVTTIASADREYVDRIVEMMQRSGLGFKALRVTESLMSSLKRFAAAEHKFTAPNRTDWSPDMTSVATCPDNPAGCMGAICAITAVYPDTLVIVADVGLIDPEFVALYSKAHTDSRLVLVKP